jgi:hypothetical protein
MAAYSSSVAATVAQARVYGSNWAYAAYSGLFSASVSDEISMIRLPRNAVIEQIVVGGTVAATAASLLVGDDAGNKSRYGTVSLSNAATTNFSNPSGINYHYSLSDDDQSVMLLLTASANTSASGSCSIHMGVWYHMPDGR